MQADRPVRISSVRIPAALALVLAVLLAGCATAPRPRATTQLPWPERRAQLQALDPYELAGRVAVSAGSEGFSAHLSWKQQGARSTVELSGALGIGGLRVVADGAALDVQTSKGERLESDQAREELSDKLGFEPPLSSLRFWLLGVPDPALPANETVGSDQRLTALVQDGWQIAYPDYLESNGYSLPRRLTIRRGDVRVRLIVYSWHPS